MSVSAQARLPSLQLPKKLGLGAAALAAAAALAVAAKHVVAGGTTDLAFAAGALLAPALLYLSITRPLISPFCLYAAFVPFNDIIAIPSIGNATKVLGLLSALCIAFWLFRTRHVVKPPVAVMAWAGMLTWMAMTGFWAVDQTIYSPLIVTIAQLFILYALVAIFPLDELEFRLFLFAVVAGGTALAAYGVHQYTHGIDIDIDRIRLQGTQGAYDPNHYAATLILPTAIAIMLALRSRFWPTKLCALGAAAILVAGVVVSASRGGALAIAILFGYYLWKSRYRLQLAIVAAVMVLACAPIAGGLIARANTVSADQGSGRESLWRLGVATFPSYWLFGAGTGCFAKAAALNLLHVSTNFRSLREPPGPGMAPLTDAWEVGPHNALTSTAVELGLPGLALLVWVVLAQGSMLKHIKPGSWLYDERLMCEAAFVALAVDALFLDLFYRKYTWLLLSTMLLVRTLSLRVPDAHAEPITAP